jgi:hypothetical protein
MPTAPAPSATRVLDYTVQVAIAQSDNFDWMRHNA